MLGGARVAVVVPARDEERLIRTTLVGIPTFVDHVVVVDDGSRDRTAQRVREVGDPRVELLRHRTTRGVGAALVSGYARAFERGAGVAAVMAGDGQMDPADLASVLAPAVEGRADYVKGDRLSHGSARSAMPTERWLANHVLTRLTRLATGVRLTDSQCGYTALTRSAAERLPLGRLWAAYGYPNDLLSLAATHGLRVAEVVVRPVYGEEESGLGLREALRCLPPVLARASWRRARAWARVRDGDDDRPAARRRRAAVDRARWPGRAASTRAPWPDGTAAPY